VPWERPTPIIAVEVSAAGHDDRHARQGDDVVDDGGLAEQALDRRQRWLVADHAALAFQALQQGRLLAADIGAGAEPQMDVERLAAALDVGPEIAGIARDLYRPHHLAEGVGIFGADIDVAFGCAHGDAGNGHAFDEDEGIALHDHAVGVGAAIAFVGIADDVFRLARRLQHGLPFDAGGETRAAAAAQTRLRDFVDDGSAGHSERVGQAAEAAMGLVVLDRQRIDDAATGEGETLLLLQEGDFLGRPKIEFVLGIRAKLRIKQGGHIGGLYRTEGDAPGLRFDLHQWLQPEQTARAIADQRDIGTPLLRQLLDGSRDALGADGQRRRIHGHIYARGHETFPHSAINSSKRAVSTRP